jgi:hypothetical protein
LAGKPQKPTPTQQASASLIGKLTPLYTRDQELKASLTALDKDWITLHQGRVSRKLKVPGTDLYIDEEDVKRFYALGLSLLLILAIVHRKRVLHILGNLHISPTTTAPSARAKPPGAASASAETSPYPSSPPFWTAPLPYGRYGLSGALTTVLNLAGLSAVGIIVVLFHQYAYRDEFFRNALFALASAAIMLFCVGYYIWAVIGAVIAGMKSAERL